MNDFYILKVRLINFLLSIANAIFGVGVPPFPSTAAIIRKGKKILVIDLNYRDGYGLPGGILKGEESFEQAIKREIKEETGLKVKSLKYFGSYSAELEYKTACVVFWADVEGKIRKSKEGKPMWINPEEAIENFVYEDNKKALKDYLKNE